MSVSKREHLSLIINRLDTYYTSINDKGQFYLSFSGALVALWSFVYVQLAIKDLRILIPLIAILIICCISTILVFCAVNPFLQTGNRLGNYTSVTFFGSIANMRTEDFILGFKNQSEDDIENDLTRQVHILSVGLNKKFTLIRVSGYFTWFSILSSMVLLIILFIQNSKI